MWFLDLTPVNEYNIVDKIHLANNKLFASIEEDNTMDDEKQYTDRDKSDRNLLQSKHRVTFSSDIEEYEDDENNEKNIEVEHIDEIIDQSEKPIENEQIDKLLNRMSIDEMNSNEDSLSDDNDYTTEVEVVEEICETISIEEIKNETQELIIEKELVNNAINEPTQCNLNQFNTKEKEKILTKKTHSIPPCRACNNLNISSANSANKNVKKTTSTLQNQRPASAKFNRNSANKNANQEDILKIYLNVRACCEHKYLNNNRLPRYNGYISQYGLSKEMLEMRELNRKKNLEERS